MAYAGMAIYDVMQHVAPDVSTICVGMGMSAAAMILCGGAAGKRFALPNSRIMIHQGSAGTRGAPSDMEIQLREVLALTRRMSEIIAHHSGRPIDQVGAGHRPGPLPDRRGSPRLRPHRRHHPAAAGRGGAHARACGLHDAPMCRKLSFTCGIHQVKYDATIQ